MRRKPSSQGGGNGGYNNQQRRPRFQPGGSNGGGDRGPDRGQHNRPRKNYAAAREKYLAQARDALSSGDRVLAENYFQHADHCYRMMVEEGYQNRNNYTPPPQGAEGEQPAAPAAEEPVVDNGNQLPAFITSNYDQPDQPKPVDPATVQNWEERDAN
jgi:hypothetical protein